MIPTVPDLSKNSFCLLSHSLSVHAHLRSDLELGRDFFPQPRQGRVIAFDSSPRLPHSVPSGHRAPLPCLPQRHTRKPPHYPPPRHPHKSLRLLFNGAINRYFSCFQSSLRRHQFNRACLLSCLRDRIETPFSPISIYLPPQSPSKHSLVFSALQLLSRLLTSPDHHHASPTLTQLGKKATQPPQCLPHPPPQPPGYQPS